MPDETGPSRFLFVTTTSIILAAASWQWLERPLNDLKAYFPYVPQVPQRATAEFKLKPQSAVGS
jgi:hypothetical protein